MKFTSWLLLAVLALVFVPLKPVNAGQPKKNKLVVKVTGIKSSGGTIKIGLFNKKAGFPNIARVMRGINKRNRRKQVVGVFSNLPAGRYAVAIVHDENNNGRLDKNILGMPKEGYGFSRNVKPMMSAPSFSATSFQLGGKTKNISIRMRY